MAKRVSPRKANYGAFPLGRKVLLGSPTSAGRRGRSLVGNLCFSSSIRLLVVMIAVVLVSTKSVFRSASMVHTVSNSTTTMEQDLAQVWRIDAKDNDNQKKSNNNKSPKANILPTESSSTRENENKMIPKRLIFSHSENILETKQPKAIYNNIQKTIQVYAYAWNQTMEQVSVLFVDNPKCREFIQRVEPRLLLPFDTETFGPYKSDICRIAVLYELGGYYNDNDNDYFRPLIPPNDKIDFVTVHQREAYQFVQNTIMVTPKHPVMKAALESMVDDWYYNTELMAKFEMKEFDATIFYQANYQNEITNHIKKLLQSQYKIVLHKSVNLYMGCITLRLAYNRQMNQTNAWLLREIYNGLRVIKGREPQRLVYKDLRRKDTGWGCNFLVHDNQTLTPYYYSRCKGTPGCPS